MDDQIRAATRASSFDPLAAQKAYALRKRVGQLTKEEIQKEQVIEVIAVCRNILEEKLKLDDCTTVKYDDGVVSMLWTLPVGELPSLSVSFESRPFMTYHGTSGWTDQAVALLMVGHLPKLQSALADLKGSHE